VKIRRKLRDRIAEIVELGLARGDFTLIGSQDHAAASLTAYVIGSMCAEISDWARPNHPLQVDDLQDYYVQMALRLVGAQGGGRPAGA
jgi:hypothetical protein